MNGRTAATAGAASAAVVALLAVGSADAARTAPVPAPTTLALTAVQSQVYLADVKPKGPSVGDRTTFAEDLFTPGPSPEKPGPRLGTDGGECVVTAVTKTKQGTQIVVSAVTSQCTATLALKGGQLTVQGLASYGWKARDTFTLAITGGTGGYTGARGTMAVTGSATATTSDLALAYTLGQV